MATGADRLLASRDEASDAVRADRRRCADLAVRLSDGLLESRQAIDPSHETLRGLFARVARELVVLAQSVREGDDAAAFEQKLLVLGTFSVETAPQPGGLIELIKLARARSLGGFCVLNQGGGATPFVAACLDYAGRISDPRTWHTYATPEEALGALLLQMRKAAAG